MASQSTVSFNVHSVGAVRRSSFGRMTAWVLFFVALFNLFNGVAVADVEVEKRELGTPGIVEDGQTGETSSVSEQEQEHDASGDEVSDEELDGELPAETPAAEEGEEGEVAGEMTSASPADEEEEGELPEESPAGEQEAGYESDPETIHKMATVQPTRRVYISCSPTKIGDKMDVEIGSPFSRFSRGEKLDSVQKSKATKNFRKIINHITGYCLKFKDQDPYGDIYTAFEEATAMSLPVDIAAELASLPDNFNGYFLRPKAAPKTILYLGKLLTERTNGTRSEGGQSQYAWDKQYETNMEALYDAIAVF
ncbi:uncharacterized protein BBOV_IV007150 [Babesia bovis T2Bo]|uniref:Membrane protein, putative n=1 Tax=Babesia bovis TaxID=5865 RepID=A7ARA2_BABBO|nr:uncharacterized protein BBOV_IV007150 [Babesia bovis T2Bo]EDO07071.1 putative integral membrane protein [Babesia bovis T2Bo]|eukprot:XP_001610639.1 hypothetical protein [Babesia bovis T2Bo]